MSGMKPVCLKWVRKTTSDTKRGWISCKHNVPIRALDNKTALYLLAKKTLAMTEGTGFNPLPFPSQPQSRAVHIRRKAVETPEPAPSRFLNTCVLHPSQPLISLFEGSPSFLHSPTIAKIEV